MALNAGTVYASLELDCSKYFDGFRNAQKKMEGFSANLKNMGDRVKDLGKSMSDMGQQLTTKLTLPIVGIGAAVIKLSSDMTENMNKVNVVFKDNAKTVEDWSKTTLKNYGIASVTSLDMASNFGDMAVSMGLTTDKAADMSMKLVGLAGDLSSFKNIGIDQAQTALKGIFTGEGESLTNLGVVMQESTLKA
jgi:hypothetical protein